MSRYELGIKFLCCDSLGLLCIYKEANICRGENNKKETNNEGS